MRIARVPDAIDKGKVSVRCRAGALVIHYGGVPLWRTIVPLEALDIFLYDPVDYPAENEPYTLMCVDEFGDIYTYGRWPTEAAAREWLANPTQLY